MDAVWDIQDKGTQEHQEQSQQAGGKEGNSYPASRCLENHTTAKDGGHSGKAPATGQPKSSGRSGGFLVQEKKLAVSDKVQNAHQYREAKDYDGLGKGIIFSIRAGKTGGHHIRQVWPEADAQERGQDADQQGRA